ncbi:pectinesterase inhibitor 8-like [Lotus japonicus]|uniref:pectinesterase inhibitor 8-like n=1 Tax=Lotus japonicus TaxID=34305 RepID=UPI002589EB31|nr:pectinesterase inhibitor 8-like [Lotus japonicus]
MINYNPLCFLCCFVLPIFLFVYPTNASSRNNATPLVDQVCANTSNYSFCTETLYSDPHTRDADRFGLAAVAFHLAYLNATATKDYIDNLLKKNSTSKSQYHKDLQKCASDYKKAVSAIGAACDDLNSESYYDLADYVGVASHRADDCQHALKGKHDSLLNSMNNDLKGLCEICVVISKLFNTIGF